jgi:hypothetical protein
MDYVGKTFNRWTVLSTSHTDKNKKLVLNCKCECGTVRPVVKANLVSGKSKSCGCWDREAAALRMTTHGHVSKGKRSSENLAYHHMVSRCENPNLKDFCNYGGRGIKVCDAWRGPDGFLNFYNHVGPKPSSNYTLDRINVNGNYEPGNVRWATRRTQAINKRIPKQNKTGIVGVWLNEQKKRWVARICVNNKQVHLITTTDFFEACCARKSAEIFYGGYA